jgi:hypothetical protein
VWYNEAYSPTFRIANKFQAKSFVDHSVSKKFFCYLLAIFPVLNLHQPNFYLNFDQPAQPPSGRIAYQQMIIRIANEF